MVTCGETIFEKGKEKEKTHDVMKREIQGKRAEGGGEWRVESDREKKGV